MKDLAFFGIQGSGKGTQGVITARKYNLLIFETGAALREIASRETDLGKKVKSIIEAGNLVTNEIVLQVIEDFLAKLSNNQNILFDGIPRSLEQKKSFDKLLKKYDRDVIGILINISEEEAKKRLLNRRICVNCKKVFNVDFKENKCDNCQGNLTKRSDDNEKAILKRIDNYYKETLPAIREYEQENKMININGEQKIEDVEKEIEKTLTKLLIKK